MASITDLSKIVYLSKAQYNTLVNDGTITVGNITITYDTDNLYIISDSDIPQGGTSGQVLTKASSTDFDTVWANIVLNLKKGSGAPTTSTVADFIGQMYLDTTNHNMYVCSNISESGGVTTYTWE